MTETGAKIYEVNLWTTISFLAATSFTLPSLRNEQMQQIKSSVQNEDSYIPALVVTQALAATICK